MRSIPKQYLTYAFVAFSAAVGLFCINKTLSNITAPHNAEFIEQAESNGSSYVATSFQKTLVDQSSSAKKASKGDKSILQEIETFLDGDTLSDVLKRHNIPDTQISEVSQLLKSKKIPVNHLRPGEEIELNYTNDEDETVLKRLSIPQGHTSTIHVVDNGTGKYDVMVEKKNVNRVVELKIANIEGNLYTTGKKHNIPSEIIQSLAQKFSHQFDFRRDVKAGDQLKVLYEESHDNYGKRVKTGPFIYAAFEVKGKTYELFKYDFPDGHTDYFDRQGNSYKRSFLVQPVKNARISSQYGYRVHPIHHSRMLHKGIDYAAPKGTPIVAAADGVIKEAKRKNGFGRYIRIAHNATYSTAYGHMSGFGKNVKEGMRVRQGDVIGYVGSDGHATGNHLHYEVLVNNVQVNPKAVNLPTGEKLDKKNLQILQAKIHDLSKNYSQIKTLTPKTTLLPKAKVQAAAK